MTVPIVILVVEHPVSKIPHSSDTVYKSSRTVEYPPHPLMFMSTLYRKIRVLPRVFCKILGSFSPRFYRIDGIGWVHHRKSVQNFGQDRGRFGQCSNTFAYFLSTFATILPPIVYSGNLHTGHSLQRESWAFDSAKPCQLQRESILDVYRLILNILQRESTLDEFAMSKSILVYS